jgi:hypothetical protein
MRICFSVLDIPRVTWVINTESGGTSQYDVHGFNSYAPTPTGTLGAAEDGIYLMTGDHDQGSPIAYDVQIPRMNYGASTKKRTPYMWALIKSNDLINVAVTVEGETFMYTSNQYSPDLQAQRWDFGRGLEGVYWSVSIQGCVPFELESVRFEQLDLKRRT